MTILVTGASGFIGSFVCEEGLRRGLDVWAGMRWSSSKQYLTQKELRFATLDLGNPETLRSQLRDCKRRLGGKGWDYVVHAAGATKSRTRQGFFRTNTEGTRNLVEALLEEGMKPKRFVFISSLSVFGAVREKAEKGAYSPILDTDTPRPNTAYGQSKLAAEQYLQSLGDRLPWVILRPTGVYGPREKDYYLMAKSIKGHVDFAVGFKRQEITFVYVRDVVQAVFLALESEKAVGKAYFLSDGEVYDSRRFSDLLQREMGGKWVLHIKAPLCFLWLVCACSQLVNRWLRRPSTLNLDKFHILAQRNWRCDITPARTDLGYQPQYPLPEGTRETVRWYLDEGWL